MKNQFGTLLKSLSVKAGVKSKELSEASNYDTTYISKWINGVKLPTKSTVDSIATALGRSLAKSFDTEKWQKFVKENDLRLEKENADIESQIKEALLSAYKKDMALKEMQIDIGEKALAFIADKKELMNLIGSAFSQINETKTSDVTIECSFDIFEFLGNSVHDIMSRLDPNIVKNVRLIQEMNPEYALRNYEFYCNTILDTIIDHEHVELNFFAAKPEDFKFIVINSYLFIQILEDEVDSFAACCSMDDKVIEHFEKYFATLPNRREALLCYAEASSMRKTNVQLDSYSDIYQKHLFNEAPAMLLPPEIMERLAENCGDDEYAEYLFKLSHIFERYTSKAKVDLIVYNSVMNEYVHDGNLSIGNVQHQLSREDVRKHIKYISDVMLKNPDFKMFGIRDTVNIGMVTKYRPSIFIDRHAVTIENSQRKLNESYHISMNKYFIEMFDKYTADIEKKTNCTKLTQAELERYI